LTLFRSYHNATATFYHVFYAIGYWNKMPDICDAAMVFSLRLSEYIGCVMEGIR